MTDQEINTTIAEACGWKCPNGCIKSLEYCCPDCGSWDHGQCDGNENYNFSRPCSHVPDYINDLNAMHEAELVLDDVQKRNYAYELCSHGKHPFTGYELFIVATRTARQRAEAFLQTIRKWKE